MAGETIMIVEDNPEIRDLIALYLSSNQFRSVIAEDGQQALRLFEEEQPDLILLDIYLPGMDGFEICREIRSFSNVPIIFISCKKDSDDIVGGLQAGADDYITKPFDPAVVVARVQANLRRAPIHRRTEVAVPSKTVDSSKRLAFTGIEIDTANFSVRVNGENIPLAAKEFQLLSFLAQHPGQVFATEELYEKLWGVSSNSDTRTVMVHISNLRKKIEAGPSTPKYIQSIRGFGYKFNPSPTP